MQKRRDRPGANILDADDIAEPLQRDSLLALGVPGAAKAGRQEWQHRRGVAVDLYLARHAPGRGCARRRAEDHHIVRTKAEPLRCQRH